MPGMKGILFIDIKRIEDYVGRCKKFDTTAAEQMKVDIIEKTSHLRCTDHPYHTSFLTITPGNKTPSIEGWGFCCKTFEEVILPIISK
jgi:hypothetical protein